MARPRKIGYLSENYRHVQLGYAIIENDLEIKNEPNTKHKIYKLESKSFTHLIKWIVLELIYIILYYPCIYTTRSRQMTFKTFNYFT
jgi:hypothetical protein